MLELEQYTQDLAGIRKSVLAAGEALHIDHMKEQIDELTEEMNQPEFWNDTARSTSVNQKLGHLKNRLAHYEGLLASADDVETMMELAREENDEEMVREAGEALRELKEKADALELETLMRGDYDDNDAVLSLHAGAGGQNVNKTSSAVRMTYVKDDVTIVVSCQTERDQVQNRATCIKMLKARLLELRDEDIEMQVYRSSGAGGQKVNKTSSAVRLIHKPTGIVVSSQVERSHFQNLENCKNMLRARLAEIKEREHLEKISDIKGVQMKIEWGSQIRSYVFMPYQLVKDLRTEYETGNIQNVMDGDLDGFINAFLSMRAQS